MRTPEQLARRRLLYTQETPEQRQKRREYGTRRAKRWREQNPIKAHRRQKQVHLKRLYGISIEQYENMEALQQGLCAVCHKPEVGRRRLAVDHHHETGQTRQLLCGKCNKGIGLFAEVPDRLRQAALYLETHHENAEEERSSPDSLPRPHE